MAMDKCIECGRMVSDELEHSFLTYDGHIACSKSCRTEYEDGTNITGQLERLAKVYRIRR